MNEKIKKIIKDCHPESLQSQLDKVKGPSELKKIAQAAIEYGKVMLERHEKLNHFAAVLEAHGLDTDYHLAIVDKLLKEIVLSDPQKPLSRKLRDEVHVIRGRAVELHASYRCPCGSCKNKRSADRYADAVKQSDGLPNPDDVSLDEAISLNGGGS